MLAPAVLLFCCAQTPAPDPRVRMIQAFPPRRSPKDMVRSPKHKQAVILVQGLDLRDDGVAAEKPRFQAWQGSCSSLVKTLSEHSDVFSIGYAQNTAVENVAWFRGFRQSIRTVKSLGYERLILMGHSAGGLIVRQFVEDFPNSGVNAVVQIATPNLGTSIADLGVKLHQVPRDQRTFISSMNRSHRFALTASRRDKRIPPGVDFITILVESRAGCGGDGVVGTESQWPRDLQLQRVPCIPVLARHECVMGDHDCIERMSSLIATPVNRWGRRQVFQMRCRLGFCVER